MKYDYFIKKYNKWHNKLSKHNFVKIERWTQRINNSYKNYFYWYDKMPFVIAPVIGCKVTRKFKNEIINLIKIKRK